MSLSFLSILAVIIGIVGLVGCILPVIPGPPISWCGLLLAFFARQEAGSDNPITLTCLFVWLGITVVVTILDYVVPSAVTRLAGGSKAGGRGALVGMIIGIFFTPLGMIPCSLLGAFLCELIVEDKSAGEAVKSSLGAFLGFLLGTGMKLIVSATMLYYIIF